MFYFNGFYSDAWSLIMLSKQFRHFSPSGLLGFTALTLCFCLFNGQINAEAENSLTLDLSLSLQV